MCNIMSCHTIGTPTLIALTIVVIAAAVILGLVWTMDESFDMCAYSAFVPSTSAEDPKPTTQETLFVKKDTDGSIQDAFDRCETVYGVGRCRAAT